MMIDAIVSGVKLTLHYDKGTYSYAHLKPEASDAAVYEVADALNSLQRVRAKAISKTETRRIIFLG